MKNTKSGYKTTEFWLALLAQALPLLVLIGVLSPDEVGAVELTLSEAIAALGAFGASLVPLYAYITGRAKVKSASTEVK